MDSSDKLAFHGHKRLFQLNLLLACLALIVQIGELIHLKLSAEPAFFILLFSILTVLLLLIRRTSPRLMPFTVAFLASTFTMITAWRLSVLAHMHIVPSIYAVALFFKCMTYLYAAYQDIQESREGEQKHYHNTRYEWQLLFIRMFIGYDLIPHFCEKLFAGPMVRAADIHDFAQLHVIDPMTMVIISGLCEFGGAIAISCGLFTRLGAVCVFLYLLVATVLGDHFHNGFIWADAGGGWEFPVMWAVLILSFSVFGSRYFSFDTYLKTRFHLPRWLCTLMG